MSPASFENSQDVMAGKEESSRTRAREVDSIDLAMDDKLVMDQMGKKQQLKVLGNEAH